MSSKPSEEAPLTVTLQATPATPSPSLKAFDFDFSGTNYEMDASIPEEERRFYLKMYPSVDVVIQRKVHCTVCRAHIGTAPSAESNIKMHPILRVTHCIKCHEFYNSGEFSKGEDGSELYCRWCGQGGEVYCCSTCPFVFCKSCIIKNLSRGVIVDIEQNENWNCFRCTSKILWPLRAQHWALINYIETQKKGLQQMQLSETELRKQLQRDHSTCCRLAKAKTNSLSDSMESLESNASKRSHASSVPSARKSSKLQVQSAKRAKLSNDEVVCTPDLLSMLEPDCQISVPQKPAPRTQVQASTITTTPRIVTVQQNYSGPSPSPSSNGSLPAGPLNSLPPPLVLSSSGMRYRQTPPNNAIVRRTVVPNAIRSAGPVFHTINGFRVDLNSAAQQDSYRLPNGRLIQVKRQVPPNTHPSTNMTRSPVVLNPQVIIRQQTSPGPVPRIAHNSPSFGSNMGIFNPQTNQQQRAPHVVRVNNGSQIQSMNISVAPASTSTPVGSNGGTTIMMTPPPVAKVPTLVRHVFPPHGIGRARTQLQDQIFNAMEICTHLTGKVQSLTHSNAYNQARSYMDLKELYIHLSYLTTYAIGRFKQLQEKCLVDMREMGFKNDANSLENGQLAAEKQASDDEDNEIEIVEPKTDTITIDSDNEEDTSSGSKATEHEGLKITSVQSTAEVPAPDLAKVDPVTANIDPNTDIDVAAFTSSILASLLEVDITEGPGIIAPKKQPRKKTTNKPNPALLHLERQRIQETKRNDAKLQMKLVVKLRRAEKDFEVARKWVEENARLRKSGSDAMANDEKQASDSVHEEPFEVIKNKSDNTNEDNIENNETKDKEKPCDAKVVEKIDNTDEIEKLKDKISVDSIDTLKANNEIKLSDNPEIVDNLEADGKETFAFKDLKADKTADKGLTPTVALLEKNSELEAMEVMEILETLGKMDVPELVKSLDAATNMKADFVDEAIKPQAATVLNYKNDTETDFSVNKDATSGDHGKIDTPEEIKSFPEKCAKDNIKTIERQNSEETGEGNDTSSAKDPEADKTSDIEKNIADSPTDNDLELQEAMEVMQSIESDVSMEVTDIIASLTSEMFEDEPVTEMEDTETYKTDANLQDASAGGEVSPSASVPAIDTTHLDNVDECNKFVDYSTATVPAEQAADDAVVAATGTTTTPELNKPADIDTPSISSQSKPILGCEQSNTQNIEMNSEDTSDHIREPESDTKDNAI